ncbi:MAG: hypothetical protein WC621_02475 [Patescibacteria group bacterium]
MDIAVLLPLYLVLGGYHHAASAAPDSPAKGLRVIGGALVRVAPFLQYRLNLVKKLLRNYRLVVAFVKFSGVAKEADIKWIGKEIRNLISVKSLTALALPTLGRAASYVVLV